MSEVMTLPGVDVLAQEGVVYFTFFTPEFNHNVAQMPVWAWATFAYLKATRTARLRWWGMLGLAAGVCALTKYASIVWRQLSPAGVLTSR